MRSALRFIACLAGCAVVGCTNGDRGAFVHPLDRGSAADTDWVYVGQCENVGAACGAVRVVLERDGIVFLIPPGSVAAFIHVREKDKARAKSVLADAVRRGEIVAWVQGLNDPYVPPRRPATSVSTP